MGEIEFGDPRLPERFWSKVSVNPETGCWEWVAGRRDDGYGVFTIKTDDGYRTRRAHRVAYIELVGPIPEGLDCDHLCRVRHCCNPAHIEPVTRKVNLNRGLIAETQRRRHAAVTHCPRGHAYDEENTRYYTHKSGCATRVCRACGRERARTDERRIYNRELKRRLAEERKTA